MVLVPFSAFAFMVLSAAEPTLFEPTLFNKTSQLRGAEIDPFAEDVVESEAGREDKWLKDISKAAKNYFKKLLSPLQTPIVTEYRICGVLDTYVNYTMKLVANATGHHVVWNRSSARLLSEFPEPEPAAPETRAFGRRRRGKDNLPPRARYINKILMYLDKEMEVVWNYKTIIDRKRWGVGNAITSSPYGPHGEHPERWRANGSFPMPTAAPNHPILLQVEEPANLIFHLKPDVREHENKYAQQLQADYESLIYNINDASQKISDLRGRLWKMEEFAQQFIVLPSGVWNKIDAH